VKNSLFSSGGKEDRQARGDGDGGDEGGSTEVQINPFIKSSGETWCWRRKLLNDVGKGREGVSRSLGGQLCERGKSKRKLQGDSSL